MNNHAQIDHFWRFEMFRFRRNPLFAQAAVTEIQERLLHALLGINRVYYFGFKWLDVVTSKLQIAPPDLLLRLRECSDVLSPQTERILKDLVEQTHDLIEKHVPDVNVDRLRRIFRYRRPLWEDLPPR